MSKLSIGFGVLIFFVCGKELSGFGFSDLLSGPLLFLIILIF